MQEKLEKYLFFFVKQFNNFFFNFFFSSFIKCQPCVAFSMCRKEPKICKSLEMDRRLLRIAFELEAFASARSKTFHHNTFNFANFWFCYLIPCVHLLSPTTNTKYMHSNQGVQRVLALCDFWDLVKVALAKNRISQIFS